MRQIWLFMTSIIFSHQKNVYFPDGQIGQHVPGYVVQTVPNKGRDQFVSQKMDNRA